MQTYLLGQVMQDEREREIRRLLARQAHLRALGRRSLGETLVRSMRRLFAPTAFGPAAEDDNPQGRASGQPGREPSVPSA